MDPINIYFFALASLIGLENMSIVSQSVTTTINPMEKTLEIYQEDLFSVIVTAEDSLIVVNELSQIAEFHKSSDKKTVEGWTVDEIVFSKNGQQLNAILKGRYTAPALLAEAGIHLDTTENSEFSLMDFPDWNIRSSEAVLKGNYWVWPVDKTVTILMEPYKNIPDKYRPYRQSILPYWERSAVIRVN